MKSLIIAGAILFAPLAMAKPVNSQSVPPSLDSFSSSDMAMTSNKLAAAAAGKNITSDGLKNIHHFFQNNIGEPLEIQQCVLDCWDNKIGDADTMECSWNCYYCSRYTVNGVCAGGAPAKMHKDGKCYCRFGRRKCRVPCKSRPVSTSSLASTSSLPTSTPPSNSPLVPTGSRSCSSTISPTTVPSPAPTSTPDEATTVIVTITNTATVTETFRTPDDATTTGTPDPTPAPTDTPDETTAATVTTDAPDNTATGIPGTSTSCDPTTTVTVATTVTASPSPLASTSTSTDATVFVPESPSSNTSSSASITTTATPEEVTVTATNTVTVAPAEVTVTATNTVTQSQPQYFLNPFRPIDPSPTNMYYD
ncbi:hypothetical protein CcaCcLH18_12319 [Colletotrichum camelliae]|nr:hypothetical protein CcaCcLH18_12319 [Colletotrichum camelliae]